MLKSLKHDIMAINEFSTILNSCEHGESYPKDHILTETLDFETKIDVETACKMCPCWMAIWEYGRAGEVKH